MREYFNFVIEKKGIKFDTIQIINSINPLSANIIFEELNCVFPEKEIMFIQPSNISLTNGQKELLIVPGNQRFFHQNKVILKQFIFKRISSDLNVMFFESVTRKIFICKGNNVKNFLLYWMVCSYLTSLVSRFSMIRSGVLFIFRLFY
jgi:hypothetical protein